MLGVLYLKCQNISSDQPNSRHAIFSPSKFDLYGSQAFPGISDLLHKIEDLDETTKKDRYKQLKKHVSDLMIMIKEASGLLKPSYQV